MSKSSNNATIVNIFDAADDLFDIDAAAPPSAVSSFPLGLWPTIVLSTVLAVIILFCVVGNLFVVSAILLERDLRSRSQYYLIFSLAIADLMVGVIVSPLMAWLTLKQIWNLGVTLCDFWISMDVLVCTSSILHLVAIALDRYWSITDIYYSQKRTPRRIFTMLMIIWVVSLIISIAPIFGWKDKHFAERVNEGQCLISQEISYQVFSTATAFYIPLCAIIIVYYKIMRAAKKRFRRERDRKTINKGITQLDDPSRSKVSFTTAHHEEISISPMVPRASLPTESMAKLESNTLGNSYSAEASLNNIPAQNGHYLRSSYDSTVALNVSTSDETAVQITDVSNNQATSITGGRFVQNKKRGGGPFGGGKTKLIAGAKRMAIVRTPMGMRKKRGVKETIENRRERKAWRTLAIITGTFIACWTPFFLVAIYRPICDCQIPPALEFTFGWLGYLNSALNPVIYTVFSTDFRCAFERILKRLFMLK